MRVNFPGQVYLVTNRTEQERFFLLPKPHIIELIGAWLAKAQKEHGDGIELYAFIFMSNHLHLLLKDTKGQLAKFMWFFQLNLAKAINRELGRQGHFFSREYHAVPVLDDQAFDNCYAYILTNAVKAGLVARAADGPFFSSLGAALAEKPLTFSWLNRTAKHNKSRRGKKLDPALFEETYELTVAIPDQWQKLSRTERRGCIEALVKASEVKLGRARRAEGRGVLGRRRILQQSPWMRPKRPARNAQLRYYRPDREQEAAYYEALGRTVEAYKTVYDGFIKAATSGRRLKLLEWPEFCYPPSSMVPTGAPWG